MSKIVPISALHKTDIECMETVYREEDTQVENKGNCMMIILVS